MGSNLVSCGTKKCSHSLFLEITHVYLCTGTVIKQRDSCRAQQSPTEYMIEYHGSSCGQRTFFCPGPSRKRTVRNFLSQGVSPTFAMCATCASNPTWNPSVMHIALQTPSFQCTAPEGHPQTYIKLKPVVLGPRFKTLFSMIKNTSPPGRQWEPSNCR